MQALEALPYFFLILESVEDLKINQRMQKTVRNIKKVHKS